ncbi:MAG: FG-GAP-like repeat-containing protein [Phycisphaerae bacterium]
MFRQEAASRGSWHLGMLAWGGLLIGLWPAPAISQVPFTEEALSRGLNYFTPERISISRFGYGVAFVDLDGDGDPDIVTVGAADGHAGVFENDGTGIFTDRSLNNGIPILEGRSGIVALDYDDDGDLDLFITQIDYGNVLARNDGNFLFTDVSTAAGVADIGRGTGATVGDYDGDGWLDIYVPNYGVDLMGQPDEDLLFHNLGNGTFTDVASALGVADPWRGWQAVFFDMDWDGDVDLYVSNDKKVPSELTMHNRLYENIGGTFSDISASSGTDVHLYSMGLGVGDFDGNNLQDVYCTNLAIEPNSLLLNQGGGVFTSSETLAGTESMRTGWGAVIFDYNNDGLEDLYVCDMIGPPIGALPFNRLYVHNGSWPCTDVGPALGVDDARDSFAVAVGDVDDDGDLDILIQNNDDQTRLYINHEGETRRWIKLDVKGQGHNQYAIGARVRTRVGSVWRDRQIIAGGNNYKSQNELIVHFGLNDALIADEVFVMWPGGTTRTLTNLETNRTWLIFPPERLGDSNADGAINVDDVVAFVGVILGMDTDPVRTALSDMDGNGGVDGSDIAAFIQALLP